MRLYEQITDLIGNTPLVRLRTGIPANIKAYVKLEFMNPTGSLKDRMTYYIIKKAVSEGLLKPGDTVIDNTSGNTGSSLAMVATMFGLKAILVTPVKTSKEKIDLIKSFGAEVIVTPEANHDDPRSFYAVARRLARENGYFDLDQYDNPDNIEAHYLSTGPELWEDTEGKITHFIAGIGTGGTFSGTARFLKEKNPAIECIAVDPEGSVFSDYIRDNKEVVGYDYKVEGIGSDVITKALDKNVVDEVITVADHDSFHRAREVTLTDGISCGGSSGSVAYAMEIIARRIGDNLEKKKAASTEPLLIGIFGDAGIRYLSKCFNDKWMREHGFLPSEKEQLS